MIPDPPASTFACVHAHAHILMYFYTPVFPSCCGILACYILLLCSEFEDCRKLSPGVLLSLLELVIVEAGHAVRMHLWHTSECAKHLSKYGCYVSHSNTSCSQIKFPDLLRNCWLAACSVAVRLRSSEPPHKQPGRAGCRMGSFLCRCLQIQPHPS